MSFLSHMNLARWVIVLSVIGSGVFGYTGWQKRIQRMEWQAALDDEVPSRAQNIQALSRRLMSLVRERERTDTGMLKDPQTGIRRLAAMRNIVLGDLRIRTGQRAPARDILDEIFTISPTVDGGWDRSNISNFMYKLEEETGRMRVTQLLLEPEQGRLKPEDIPGDKWDYEIEVTLRQKVSE